MQTLYHGSRVIVEYPEIRVQRFQKDFFWGFYCTAIERQAVRRLPSSAQPGPSMSTLLTTRRPFP